MPAPDRLDPNSVTWLGPSGARQAEQEVTRAKGTNEVRKGAADATVAESTIGDRITGTRLDNVKGAQQVQYGPLEQSRAEMASFNSLPPVRRYTDGISFLHSALNTRPDPEGDNDLITLAAKIQDPTGSVMQGDIERYNNIQTALERLPQRFRNEWERSGVFTPRTRNNIRDFLIRRINSYKLAYETERDRYTQRIERANRAGQFQIDPLDVVGPHPGEKFFKSFAEYDSAKSERRKSDPAGREGAPPAGNTVGAFQRAPEGSTIAGEDIKGWRFSPESEAAILGYLRSPEATAEGYAEMVADRAVAEGHIAPEARDDYARANLDSATQFLDATPPEARGGASIDYSGVDKSATENAGVVDSAKQALRNVPESAAQLAEGALALPVDAVRSLVLGERVGSVRALPDLAMELVQQAGGDPSGPMTNAVVEMLSERYGGIDEIKRTAVRDPAGLATDLQIALSGGAKLARLGGQAGQTVAGALERATPGAMIDRATAAVPRIVAKTEGLREGAKNVAAEVAGFPSGVGGAPLREAFRAGRDSGRAGGPTRVSEAFTDNMRDPDVNVATVVDRAREAVANLREAASQRYQQDIASLGVAPAPLDIDAVRQKLAAVKPKSYDTWKDRDGPRPAKHRAWEQMNQFVEEYAAKAQDDPSLLEPLQMDQFKQDLYDVGAAATGTPDRQVIRIASAAYNGVKDLIVQHDPTYAKTMRDYELAAKEAQELEQSFSLSAARGKPVNVDAATRKLQSIMRNNAYTNYAQRSSQGQRLADLDPSGTILPSLAGQSVSTLKPRGLGALAGTGLAGVTGIAAAAGNPSTLFALGAAPVFSPRVMGELAYGAGKLTGATGRMASAAAPTVRRAGQAVGRAYQTAPTAALLGVQSGSRLQEADERERLRRYGVRVAPIDDLDTVSTLRVR